jgi:hypothetical protein
MVEERKTFNFFLKPHEVSDFPLVKMRAAPYENLNMVDARDARTRGQVPRREEQVLSTLSARVSCLFENRARQSERASGEGMRWVC